MTSHCRLTAAITVVTAMLSFSAVPCTAPDGDAVAVRAFVADGGILTVEATAETRAARRRGGSGVSRVIALDSRNSVTASLDASRSVTSIRSVRRLIPAMGSYFCGELKAGG